MRGSDGPVARLSDGPLDCIVLAVEVGLERPRLGVLGPGIGPEKRMLTSYELGVGEHRALPSFRERVGIPIDVDRTQRRGDVPSAGPAGSPVRVDGRSHNHIGGFVRSTPVSVGKQGLPRSCWRDVSRRMGRQPEVDTTQPLQGLFGRQGPTLNPIGRDQASRTRPSPGGQLRNQLGVTGSGTVRAGNLVTSRRGGHGGVGRQPTQA